MVEKTGRRGYAILMLAPIVCTSERATAGATKSEKSFFLTGSLQSITWGAARKEKKSDRIRDFQIMAVSYATGVLIVSEIPKRKAPLCDKCAHLRFKRAKNDVCCRYVCNFWDLPPFDDPPEFCNRFEEKK